MMIKKTSIVFCTLLLLHVTPLSSQNVGINDNGAVPNSSAILDVDISTNNKGLLIPRLTLAERKTIPALGLTEEGLTVYDTDTKCYWLWDGTQWVRFRMFDVNSNDSWQLTGNGSTIDGVNFIGTYDNVALNFKVNNQNSGRIDPLGSTFFGYKSGDVNTQTTNSGFGFQSLIQNTSGGHNSAFGFNAMYGNLTGNNNTSFGYSGLTGNISGNDNTAIGNNALALNFSGDDNTAIGSFALYKNSGIGNVAIGKEALYENTTTSYNIGIGLQALKFNNIGFYNVAVGTRCLYLNTSGKYNTGLGDYALMSNVSGDNNTASGYFALKTNDLGVYNSAFGVSALQQNYDGNGNSAFGSSALSGNTSGNYNTAIGYQAGINHIFPLTNATYIGYASGITTGSNRISVGNSSISYIGGQVGWSVFSDKRIKTNIKEDVPGLQFITKLKPVTYNLDLKKQYEITNQNKKDTTPNWEGKYDIEKVVISGFLAQDVEAVAKSINYNFSGITPPKNENDLYSIRYAEFVVPLVKAVQEQQKQIEELKNKVEELKKLIRKQ